MVHFMIKINVGQTIMYAEQSNYSRVFIANNAWPIYGPSIYVYIGS